MFLIHVCIVENEWTEYACSKGINEGNISQLDIVRSGHGRCDLRATHHSNDIHIGIKRTVAVMVVVISVVMFIYVYRLYIRRSARVRFRRNNCIKGKIWFM